MGMNSDSLIVMRFTADKIDCTNQIGDIDESLLLESHHYSNEQREIQGKAKSEMSLIKNEMDSLDDKTGSEYEKLMQEYKDIRDERDNQLEHIEQTNSDAQAEKQSQKDELETRVQFDETVIKSFDENREEYTTRGYFNE